MEELRGVPEFIPDLSLVARQSAHVVGHALFSRLLLPNEAGGVDALALGPVAVLPEWQRQGIGGQLIRAGLERGRALGYGAVILIGHPSYYPRFGFVPAGRYGLTSPIVVPDEVFMALPLRPDGLEAVSGMVRFADPFLRVR